MTRLVTDEDGPGSILEIEEYIATVIREWTDMKPDTREVPATTPERLAQNIRTSVLNRLEFKDWNRFVWTPSEESLREAKS